MYHFNVFLTPLSTPTRSRVTSFDGFNDGTTALGSKEKSRNIRASVISSAAKAGHGLQSLLRLPSKKKAPHRPISETPSPNRFSIGPPVLTLESSTFARTSLFPELEAKPSKDLPKRRHTYKLFPSSTPVEIISPVYGVDILKRDIECKDYDVVLPRLRQGQNCTSYNSTPPITSSNSTVTTGVRRSTSLGVNDNIQVDRVTRPHQKEDRFQQSKNGMWHKVRKHPEARVVHKENIHVRLSPNLQSENIQNGNCLRKKIQPAMESFSLREGGDLGSNHDQKCMALKSQQSAKPQNNFDYYRAKISQLERETESPQP